jgi:hypothetical protein
MLELKEEIHMDPKLQVAVDTIVTALNMLPDTVAEPPVFWKPTSAQKVSFATRVGWTVADLDGNRQANNSPLTPKIPVCDGSINDALTYAAFGFDPTGLRVLWTPDNRESARQMCDRLARAGNFSAANEVIDGAGAPGVTQDLACFLVLTGMTVGGGLLGTPRLLNYGWSNVGECLAWYMAAVPPGPKAPGPGI